MAMVEMDVLSGVINGWPTTINAEAMSGDQPYWL